MLQFIPVKPDNPNRNAVETGSNNRWNNQAYGRVHRETDPQHRFQSRGYGQQHQSHMDNKDLDQVPSSTEADLKRLFNPVMVVENTVPKQTNHNTGQLLTSANRPQCNGKNERVNQTLVAKLRCKVNSTTKIPWTKLLEQVTYEYNYSPHDVTDFPSAYLMFGALPYDSTLPNQVKLNYPPIQQARPIAVNRTIKYHKINKQWIEAHYKRLSEFERGRLNGLKETGWANQRIARHLGRNDAVIRRC
ncbi:retrotransposable element Tf2 protein type 1 [Trichonephila clavipes]|nr:retrotransposable element Tf2 protein type 1 [Trichonephila clavipes]